MKQAVLIRAACYQCIAGYHCIEGGERLTSLWPCWHLSDDSLVFEPIQFVHARIKLIELISGTIKSRKP